MHTHCPGSSGSRRTRARTPARIRSAARRQLQKQRHWLSAPSCGSDGSPNGKAVRIARALTGIAVRYRTAVLMYGHVHCTGTVLMVHVHGLSHQAGRSRPPPQGPSAQAPARRRSARPRRRSPAVWRARPRRPPRLVCRPTANNPPRLSELRVEWRLHAGWTRTCSISVKQPIPPPWINASQQSVSTRLCTTVTAAATTSRWASVRLVWSAPIATAL